MESAPHESHPWGCVPAEEKRSRVTQPAARWKAPEHGPTGGRRSRGPRLLRGREGSPEGGRAPSPASGVAPVRGPPWRSGSTPAVSVTPLCRAAGAGRGRGGGRGGGGPAHPASRRRSLPAGLRGRTRRRASSGRGASLRSSPGRQAVAGAPARDLPERPPRGGPQLSPLPSITRGSRAGGGGDRTPSVPACPPITQPKGTHKSSVRRLWQRERAAEPPGRTPPYPRSRAVAPARALFAAVSERSGAASSPAPGL